MKSILPLPGSCIHPFGNAAGKKTPGLLKQLLTFVFCLTGLLALSQPTTLVAGDAAIIGFNAQTTDRFSIVLLRDINANTVINVTDNGMLAGNVGRTNEGFVTYTAPSAQTKGTVLTWFNGMTIAGTGWSSNNPANFAINGSGDQLFLFQGSTGNWGTQSGITLIYGANFGVPLSGTSASANTLQPASLPAPYFLNVPTSTFYNCYFANGSSSATTVTVSGTPTALLNLFSDGTKWFGGSGAQVTFPTWNITVSGSSPNIATTGTLSALSTTYGTASGFAQFSVSGTNLTNNITINAPSGFEISKTAGGASGYATSQSLTQSGGNVASTTIYVRLAATTTFGSYSGNVTLAASPASATVATVSSSVARKGLTVSGASGVDKVYNRSTSATISGATAVGTVNGDAITLSGGGTFANFNVGNNIAITAALTVSGTNSNSYTLTQPSGLNADITPKDLTIDNISVNNKTYDGNTDATVSGTLTGVIAPDDVALNFTAGFETPFAGTAVPVVSSAALVGADIANYNLVQPSGLSADIAPKELTITGATAQNKVFDGNTDAVITGTLSGVIAPDDVTLIGTGVFASPNVGLNIPVTATCSIIGDIANYTLAQPTGLAANISAEALLPQTITFNPLADVVYGSADFTLGASSDSNLTINYNSSDSGVATVSGNTVTIVGVGTTTITATQPGDLTYDAAEPVLQTLTVTPKELTIADALAADKIYNGDSNTSVSGTLSGVVGSDDVAFTGSANFAAATVGNDIAVTSNLSLTGTDAGNYTLAQPSGLTADITPKALTVTGALAVDKVYDATTNATINGAALSGIVGSDDVAVSGNGTFASADAANNIPVTAQLALSGTDAGNYILTQPSGLQADITPAPLSVSGLIADNKIYDRTTAATISGTAVLDGIIGSDAVSVSGTAAGTFDNKNVGIAKTVTLSGLVLNGAQALNYSLSGASTTADITVKSIAVSGADAQDKPFDGNTSAVVTGTLLGVIAPDVVTLVGTGTFATSSVGTNIAVTSTSTLSGTDAGNYSIDPQPTGLTANILPAPVALAVWTYETLNGVITAPTPNIGTGTSSLVGSMSGLSMATGMNTASGCGAQTSGTQAWAIASAAPGTNESSGARFSTSTVGYQNIKVTWEQRWSNTSANTLRLQYTTNGTNWTNFTMTADNTTFCLGNLNNGRFETNSTGDQYRRISVDLSSIAAANDNPNFGVRIVAAHYQSTGQFRQNQTPTSVASGGTWRFDNVKFEAVEIPLVPPTASVLSGTATICAGESANLSVSISGGTAPFVVTYTDGTDNFIVNNYASGSNIPVAPTTNTTYTLVSVVDANTLSGTGNSGSVAITVNQLYPFYADADGDGYGTGSAVNICAASATTPPAGYAILDGDCNDAVAAVHPNAIEIPYNGTDDDCDGSIDETGTVTTALLSSSCGTTLASIGSLIGIQTVAGHNITGYRIRIANGSDVQVIEKTVPHFTIPQFASYAYATTYTVDIQLQRAGIWQANWGATCLVSTPAILEEGGAASVSPSQCGITLSKINALIATTSIQGVTGYRFRISNTTDPLGPNAVQTIDRAQNWFSLQMLTRYNYGTTYRIEVAVKTTGAFGGFGSPCEVSSPAAPSLVNCGGIVASGTAPVAATSVEGATQYRFQIVRQSDNASTTIDRNQNWFIFNSIPSAAFTAGALYSVRVAVLTKGSWSPFGDVCEVTAPGAVAKGVSADNGEIAVSKLFKATAYPNPFTAAFNLDIVSDLNENVQVKVYDMLGRLMEASEIQVSDLKSFGGEYPSGVYNIIVSQGNTTQTLRVVKR